MSILAKGLAKLFGSKSDRDIKDVMPYVKEINEEFESLKSISDDELRNKTTGFKNRIAESLKNIDDQLETLHKSVAEDNFEYSRKRICF